MSSIPRWEFKTDIPHVERLLKSSLPNAVWSPLCFDLQSLNRRT